MRNAINFFSIAVLLLNTEISSAQINTNNNLPKLPSMSNYFNKIKAELMKPEYNRVDYVEFQIVVMSQGNDPTVENKDNWFSSFGNSHVEASSFRNSSPANISNEITYWFNDRPWNSTDMQSVFEEGCCVDKRESNPNSILGNQECMLKNGRYPFSTVGKEIGTLNYAGSSLNLFQEWNWKVKKYYFSKSILYGELENGHTFSLSYRFYTYPRVN